MLDKSKIWILVGCEESQRVVSEWRRRGYDNAYSCDVLPCTGGHPEWHIMGDVTPLINGNCKFYTMDGIRHEIKGEWSLAQYFTPCTFSSCAGASRMFVKDKATGQSVLNKKRYRKGLKMVNLFLKCWKSNCRHIAMENPTPMWNLWKQLPKNT